MSSGRAMEKSCTAGFTTLGFIEGERGMSLVRLVCTVVTVSIISSWYSRPNIGRMLLFYSHWLSGLIHLMACLVLEQMVLICEISANLTGFVKFMKFVELATGNMLAVTNVAVCVNLALIVRSHRTVSRVKSVSSPRTILLFTLISMATAAAPIPLWDNVFLAGEYFFLYGRTKARANGLILAYFIMETIASVIMTTIVGLLVKFRLRELCQVWQLNRRIKLHLVLTAIAIAVDIGITVAGLVVIVYDAGVEYIFVTWNMRYVHIALDTIALYFSLATPAFSLESEEEIISTIGTVCVEEGSESPETSLSTTRDTR